MSGLTVVRVPMGLSGLFRFGPRIVLGHIDQALENLNTGSLVLSDGRAGPASVRSSFRHVPVSVGWFGLGCLDRLRSVQVTWIGSTGRDEHVLL